MTVKFRVPDDPAMLESESTELFLLMGLNWLSETEDCKFEVQINGQVGDCHAIQISADEDAPVMHHVPVPSSLLIAQGENQLKVLVKSGLSPL